MADALLSLPSPLLACFACSTVLSMARQADALSRGQSVDALIRSEFGVLGRVMAQQDAAPPKPPPPPQQPQPQQKDAAPA